MTASRDALLDKMADHVLTHGLTQATLRPLALAAGTSDRMLIYYFASKDGVIAALLDHLAGRLTAMLDAADLPQAKDLPSLLSGVLGAMKSPAARPYFCLWLEVVAGAARGLASYKDPAARILDHFTHWLMPRLPPGLRDQPGAEDVATLILTLIEGALVLSSASGDARTEEKLLRGLTHAMQPARRSFAQEDQAKPFPSGLGCALVSPDEE